MVSDSIRWELPSEKCIEIIHLTLIDILSDNKENPMLINRLVQLLNQKTNTYKLHKNKRYNSFSKYLKIKHSGFLNFVEKYNFYEVIKSSNMIHIKLHPNLVDRNNLKDSQRYTKDSEWVFIDDLGDECL